MVNLIIEVAILFSSLVVLLSASEWVIDASNRIAHLARLKELVIGFVLIAIATSIPELSVSFQALVSGDVGISIGNLLGSNVADICLVVGIAALLSPLVIRKKSLKELTSILFISSLIPLLLLSLTFASKFIGVVLIMIFVAFSYFSVKKNLKSEIGHQVRRIRRTPRESRIVWSKTIALFTAGIVGVLVSSRFLVDSAVEIANSMGIAEAVIGATVIAVGTSLPELAVSITAIRKKRWGLALGNAIGSVMTNITLVLGFVLVTSSFVVDLTIFETIIIFVLLTNIVLWFFVDRGRLDRRTGLILIFMYLMFLITVFGVQVAII